MDQLFVWRTSVFKLKIYNVRFAIHVKWELQWADTNRNE